MNHLPSEFILKQKQRIMARLARYNDRNTIIVQSEELSGEISGYTRYKGGVVRTYLEEAMQKIENGSYGICTTCGNDIPMERLKLVPAALRCVKCENDKSKE